MLLCEESEGACWTALLVVFDGRHFVEQFNERDADLVGGVAAQSAPDKVAFGDDEDGFERAADDAGEEVGEAEAAEAVVGGKLDKLGERIVVELDRVRASVVTPLRDGRRHVEVHAEADFCDELRAVRKRTAARYSALCEKIVRQTRANVVTHFVELLIDRIHILIVRNYLPHKAPIPISIHAMRRDVHNNRTHNTDHESLHKADKR
mmetsp:Transcript_3878/g.10671  ORF Transcript_3878/g.10671 Transcript_3878/m.10671 type:complete len:207 (+) Transcript_3878:407-1027(+)